ncbi:MAG: radical SAM protein [Candidatus Omnitrophota bacterium]
MKKHYIIPFFIPHKGCPFTCIFCNQAKISGRKVSPSTQTIISCIRKRLKAIPLENTYIEVAFFGGSFTGLDKNIQLKYLESVRPFLDKGRIKGIRISTRPDYINEGILNLLKNYGVKRIELGVQSMSDSILKKIKRGHTFSDIKRASSLILKNGFELGHQMMVGLPGSSEIDEIETARKSIRMGITEVRIYPVLVIKGTRLAAMWKNGRYAPITETAAVKRCAGLIKLFENSGVRVIRSGLHPSKGLLLGSEILAGPFHVAFRQKCETFIYGKIFENFFSKEKNKLGLKRILYNPVDTAYVIGYGRSNAGFVEKTLRTRNIFKPSSTVKPKSVKIEFKDRKAVVLKK